MGILNNLLIGFVIVFVLYGVFKFAWWVLDILENDE